MATLIEPLSFIKGFTNRFAWMQQLTLDQQVGGFESPPGTCLVMSDLYDFIGIGAKFMFTTCLPLMVQNVSAFPLTYLMTGERRCAKSSQKRAFLTRIRVS